MRQCFGQPRRCVFCGFLRSGEVVSPFQSSFNPSVHPCYGDVTVDSTDIRSVIQVRLKASKTDPFRNDVSVYLGITNGAICPVAAILDFMVRRGLAIGIYV